MKLETRQDRVVDTETNMVAVLYSPGYGAGWSTWGHGDHKEKERMLFCPELVYSIHAELHGEPSTRKEVVERLFPDEYHGGVEDLEIEWLPMGTRFFVREYDGSEHIQTLLGQQAWTA